MLNRRNALWLMSGAAVAPNVTFAASPKEITWDDLIPPGIAYSEIIGEGDLDEINDTWNPIYDDNATVLNEALDGAYIKMPGFIIPLDTSAQGVTNFMLVPYTGACIHTPPPPANQLVMVETSTPWSGETLWDPVWVTGTLRTHLQSTSLGQTGYSLLADKMENYTW